MIKAIMFDLGGVLIELKDEKVFLNFLVQNSEFRLIDMKKIEWLIESINIGTFRVRDAYHFLCETYKFNGSYQVFKKKFNELIIGKENGSITDFLKLIKPHYQILLLSNTNAVHFQYVKAHNNFFMYFDKFFLSYKIQLMKPDIRIFEFILKKLSVLPEEILFIDDTKSNLQVAQSFGIHILYNERNSNPIPKIQSYLKNNGHDYAKLYSKTN